MSESRSHSLREDHQCLNCGQTVPERFCSFCGQENTEPRQSFAHLAGHFFEDLTHYEGKFWSTIKYLLFKPGYLTQQYLAGKRTSYVMPVRLYIFISFVTFLLPNFLPDFSKTKKINVNQEVKTNTGDEFYFSFDGLDFDIYVPHLYASMEALEKAELAKPADQRLSGFNYWLQKKYIQLSKYSPQELGKKFRKAFSSNIPKTLFLFMPLFALVLWIFSDRKKYWYFDQGIFTLHYFSFVLLVFNLHSISSSLSSGLEQGTGSLIWLLVTILLLIVYPAYFILARKNAFQLTGLKNYLVSVLVISINLILFLFALSQLLLISLFLIE